MKNLCILLLIGAAGVAAQTRLEGELVSDRPADLAGLAVRLYESGRGGTAETTLVERNGSFVFRSVPTGSYTLQVLDLNGNVVAWEMVSVSSSNAPVTVRLPEQRSAVPAGQTVSAGQLLHPPARRALRDAAKGRKFAEAGDHGRAAEELEKAVAEDPHYAEGYNNLGVQYARLGRSADAIQAFRRAVELDPGASKPRTNLAILLAQAGRFSEAEGLAREGVRLDPANEKARQVLDSIVAVVRKRHSRG